MKKALLLITTCMLFVLSACTYNVSFNPFSNGYKGTGEIETRKFDLNDFDGIDATGGIRLYFVKDDDYDISIETNADIFERLEVKTSNNKLLVKPKDGINFYDTKIKVIVKCPTLKFIEISNSTSLEISGDYKYVGDVHIDVTNSSDIKGNLSGEKLTLDVTNSSKAQLSGNYKTLEADVTNSSEAQLSGTYKDIEVDVTNSSEANLRDIEADFAKIDLSNASDCDIEITGTIEITASNGSDLNVYNGKVVKEDLSNASEINYK